MSRLPKNLLLYVTLALIALATTLAYAHALPAVLGETPGVDKLMHFTLFGMLTLGLMLSLGDRRWRVGPLSLPLMVVVPLLLAAIEEGLQGLSPYRTLDIWDLVSDAAGMLSFWWLGRHLAAVKALEPQPTGDSA